MEYKTINDVYRSVRESYIGNLYETAKESYNQFIKKSREISQCLLGDYSGEGFREYMKKMPSIDHRTQEYFS